jgi:hypothetical protein
LYHAAREHGPAVLAESDPALRREVELLLEQDSEESCWISPLLSYYRDRR